MSEIAEIFNEDTRKLKCSTCNKTDSSRPFHNQRAIQQTSSSQGYYCRKRLQYPLCNKCLTAKIVNKVVLSTPSKLDKKDFSIVEITFKERFRNHAKDFHEKSTLATLKFLVNCGK